MPVDPTDGKTNPRAFTIAIIAALMIGAAALIGVTSRTPTQTAAAPRVVNSAAVSAKIAALPLYFEKNQGQSAAAVQYLAHAGGYTLFLTRDAAVFSIIGGDVAGVVGRADPIALARHAKIDPKNQPKLISSAVRIRLIGASANARVVGAEPLPGKVNYLIGNDPKRWHREIPTFGRVRYTGVYPGIDLVFYGTPDKLEYDLIAQPGADTGKIKFAVEGPAKTSLLPTGDLLIATAAGSLVMRQPRVYQQQKDGTQTPVEGKFTVGTNGVIEAGIPRREVGFDLARYDRSKTIVIDPQVVTDSLSTTPQIPYSSYIGGSGGSFGQVHIQSLANIPFVNTLHAADVGLDVAIDSAGDAYIGGVAFSSNYPAVNAFQSSNNGGGTPPNQNPNAIVSKFDPAQSGAASLIYSTYLGGSGDTVDAGFGDGDQGTGIAVDSSGNAYLVGLTYSADFPGTASCGTFGQHTNQLAPDQNNGFVAALNPAGSSVVACYIHGSVGAPAWRVALNTESTQLFIVGSTASNSNDVGTDFPATFGAPQITNPELNGNRAAYLISMGTNLQAINFATFYGGTGNSDLGGEAAFAVATDPITDLPWMTGLTYSSNDGVFPLVTPFQTENGAVQSGGSNAFVAGFEQNFEGFKLSYSSFFGGGGISTDFAGGFGEIGTGIAVDSSGIVYISGIAFSENLITTGNNRAIPYQATQDLDAFNNNAANVFVAKLNPAMSGDAQALYTTYLGGGGTPGFSTHPNTSTGGGDYAIAMAIDGFGNVFLTGATTSVGTNGNHPYPTTSGVCGPTNRSSGFLVNNISVPVTAFVTELDTLAGRGGLAYSTYLGGSGKADIGTGIAYEASTGFFFVSGVTYSTDFPATSNAFQIVNNAAANSQTNAFLTEINPGFGAVCPTPFPTATATPSATSTATPTSTATATATATTTATATATGTATATPTPTATATSTATATPTPTATATRTATATATPTATVTPTTTPSATATATSTATATATATTTATATATGTATATPTATPTPSGAILSVSPLALDFPARAPGGRATRRFRITNTGTSNLIGYVNPLEDTGFRVRKGGGDFNLAPGQSRVVVVVFAPPRGAETYSSNVLITSNDPNLRQVSVTLFGEGKPRPKGV